MRHAALSIGLLLVPAVLLAQDGRVADYALALEPEHAGHAELHRPGPVDAGVELAAVRMLGLDRDVAALCRAAELAMAVGLLTDPHRDSARLGWFREAEAYALRAQALRPDDPEALYMEGAALGLQAGHLPLGEKVRTANRVLELSHRILELDPDHPGGLHLLGRLTAEGMRVNPVVRFVVARTMGGELLKQASWEDAEAALRAALEAEPDNAMHRLELAYLLRDTGRDDAARDQLRRVLAYPDTSALVGYYKERARDALRRLD